MQGTHGVSLGLLGSKLTMRRSKRDLIVLTCCCRRMREVDEMRESKGREGSSVDKLSVIVDCLIEEQSPQLPTSGVCVALRTLLPFTYRTCEHPGDRLR